MAAFAVHADIATRLGRDLTTKEQAQATAALDAIAGLIREAAGKAADWTPSPAIPLYKTLSIEKVVGVITNPANLAAESEQLGDHEYSQTFPRAGDIGIFLTDAEERRVCRAAFHTNSASPRMTSELVEDSLVYDIYHKEDIVAGIE